MMEPTEDEVVERISLATRRERRLAENLRRAETYWQIMEQIAPYWHPERMPEDQRRRFVQGVVRRMHAAGLVTDAQLRTALAG